MNDSELAKRLVELRQEHGYSRKKLADMLSMSYGTIDNYEACRRAVPTDFVVKLADLYGMTTDEILGIKKEPAQDEPEQVSFAELFGFLKGCGIVSSGKDLSDSDVRFLATMLDLCRQWFE